LVTVEFELNVSLMLMLVINFCGLRIRRGSRQVTANWQLPSSKKCDAIFLHHTWLMLVV
jgi:hypothetical protein